jgi:hypothetical protein
MKKIVQHIALIAGLGLALTSCESYFEDQIASPNSPTSVSPDLLLTNVEVATFANYGGQLARQTQIMTQHMAGTSAGSQTIEIMNYNITELTNENEWDVIYAGALINGRILLRDFGAENPHYAGIMKVLMAMNLGVATDLWGDVPYSDALNGESGNLNPLYDSQQDLYDEANVNSIFELLSSAVADLQQPASANVFTPSADDLIFNGNIAKWIAVAHSLRARYYNHLSQVDAAGSATDALAAITDGAIASSADNAYMVFGPNGNEQNQWYAYNQQRGNYIKTGEFFVDLLKANSDPRLEFFADSLANGDYVGTPKDDVDSLNTSDVGTYLNSLTAQIPIISFVETKFIEAEARLRSGDAPGAALAYNEAVIASVTEVTGAAPDAAFIAAYASATGGTIDLETIMTQKYIAMYGQIEAYTDFRRTGFPAGVTPNPTANINSIPVRLILPQNERLYNTNFPTDAKSLTDPVYWDQ